VMTPLYALASFLFIAGGSTAFIGAHLELHDITWKNTALLLSGLGLLVVGMALSRRSGQQ